MLTLNLLVLLKIALKISIAINQKNTPDSIIFMSPREFYLMLESSILPLFMCIKHKGGDLDHFYLSTAGFGVGWLKIWLRPTF